MGIGGKRKFFVGVIIISLIIIVLNIFVGIYAGSMVWKNPYALSGAANVSLVILPYWNQTIPNQTIIVPGPSAGGGGGGLRREAIYDFELDQTVLKVSLRPGEFIDRNVQVINPNSVKMNFTVVLSDSLEGKVVVLEEGFVLGRNIAKDLGIRFIADVGLEPGIYTGHIIFKSEYSEKKLPVIFEVRSIDVAFEVNLDTPAEYKSIDLGEDLFFQVSIRSVGEIENGNIHLQYLVKDFNDNVIVNLTEYIYVNQQVSFGKTITLPDGIPQGDYVVSVIGRFDSSTSVSSEIFSVGEEGLLDRPFMVWLWVLLIGLFIFLLVILRELNKMKVKRFVKDRSAELSKIQKKIVSGHIQGVEAENELRKLKMQRELLERARSGGYIKEGAYKESKRKIEEVVKKIRKKYL